MLIAEGSLARDCLAGQVVVVTGAGRGIGFEAARSLLCLGAHVVIAEIDEAAGRAAHAALAREWAPERVQSVPTDVGDEHAVARLVETVEARFGPIDVVLNNATAAPTGEAVWETPVADWDRSYAANLRGPALLARAVLPGMIERGRGVFVCVSSVGGPYQAAYESLKAAQVALANALDAELSGTGVVAFTIGPGLVPTPTAVAAVRRLIPRLGLGAQEFLSMTAATRISVEAAGAGFAAAIALADRYAGQEISSTQALVDAGVELPDTPVEFPVPALPEETRPTSSGDGSPGVAAAREGNAASMEPARSPEALELCRQVRTTLDDQAAGWRTRSFFERQWLLRDFKQRVGVPVEGCLESLATLERNLESSSPVAVMAAGPTLQRLAAFYAHLSDLARGYVKDPSAREDQVRLVGVWRADVERLLEALNVAGTPARR